MAPPLSIYMLSSWQVPCGIAAYTTSLTSALGQSGDRVVVEPIGPANCGDLTPDQLVGKEDAIVRRSRDFDVVHIQHEYSFFLYKGMKEETGITHLGRLVKRLRLAGCPLVITFHSQPPGPVPLLRRVVPTGYPVERAWQKQVIRRLRDDPGCHSIVHTTHTRERFIRQGVPPGRVTRLPLGIPRDVRPQDPSSREQALAALGYGPGTRLLALFGFISPYKGTETALESLLHLPPHFHLALVGGTHPQAVHDPTFDRLLSLLRRHPALKPRVRITGYAPPADFLRYQEAASYCLAPYRNVPYSGSAAIGSALASGVPVIASRIPTFEEIEGESRALRLVSPESPTELAGEIKHLEAHPVIRHALVAAAFAYVDANAWSRVAERHRHVYRAVVSPGSLSPASPALAP
ncbi:MAG: glycosyltransferase [Candidatus Methylacidiphilales bacterium]|nr:glycosyltransferase [Candidatus Methylacidiphilales bacterium]